ncbi:MAG: hypothetical protein IEMM0008_0074 [bacterium]|nr:MAG: hypothetical protein IEMM0008_0074 [bacterium]
MVYVTETQIKLLDVVALTVDDLAEEYDFDYQKARPNRFADKLKDRIT